MLSTPPKSLLFLHIPKTAGTTLKGIISRQYPSERMVIIGEDVIGSIVSFRERPTSEWETKNIIQGHMSFGLHRFMQPPFGYVTMLRKPLPRAVSDYAFVTSTPQHPIYQHVKDLSFAEYMTSNITGQLSNGQTRLLCGDCEDENFGVPTLRKLEQTDLECAKNHIDDHVIVIGLQEHFDESLVLFKHRLGWKLPFYISENITRRPFTVASLTPKDQELVDTQNNLDLELYNYALKLFESEINALGAKFKVDLAAFRILNRAFQTYVKTRARIGPVVRRFIPRTSTAG